MYISWENTLAYGLKPSNYSVTFIFLSTVYLGDLYYLYVRTYIKCYLSGWHEKKGKRSSSSREELWLNKLRHNQFTDYIKPLKLLLKINEDIWRLMTGRWMPDTFTTWSQFFPFKYIWFQFTHTHTQRTYQNVRKKCMHRKGLAAIGIFSSARMNLLAVLEAFMYVLTSITSFADKLFLI